LLSFEVNWPLALDRSLCLGRDQSSGLLTLDRADERKSSGTFILRAVLEQTPMAYRLIAALSLLSLLGAAPQTVARTETFAEFFVRFRAALASGRAADVAALTHTPFLYEGKQLDTAGFTRVVPTLFSAAVKRCFSTARPVPEDDRQVVFCKPYAFYFGRDEAAKGGIRLLEFAADGEEAR
jgi:hypothetical protein